jgi:RNA polymerase sigma-70 factor (ECF subfamily)
LTISARFPTVSPTVPEQESDQFGRLFIGAQREILRYILALVPDIDDAHEILQETAVDLWRKFDRYDTAHPFAPWACRFAFRCVLKHREQQARQPKCLSIELLAQVATERAIKDGFAEERRRALEACLQQLCEADRLVVEHRYLLQMPVEQIARITGRNPDTLYKTLERTRRRLFECVKCRLSLGSRY